jgi:YD repeat-containing protein
MSYNAYAVSSCPPNSQRLILPGICGPVVISNRIRIIARPLGAIFKNEVNLTINILDKRILPTMGQVPSGEFSIFLDPDEFNRQQIIKKYKVKRIETSFFEIGDSTLNRTPITFSIEEFDLESRKIKTKLLRGNSESTQEFSYDIHGRLATKTSSTIDEDRLFNVSKDTLKYDSIDGGLLIRSTLLRTASIERYDTAGKIYKVEFFTLAGLEQGKAYQINNWIYDRNGQLIEIIANDNIKLSFTYDSLGNIKSKKWSSKKEKDKMYGFDYGYEGSKLVWKKGHGEKDSISFKYQKGLLTEINDPENEFTIVKLLKYEFY